MKTISMSRAGMPGQPPGPDAGSSAARAFAAAPGHRSVPALDRRSGTEVAGPVTAAATMRGRSTSASVLAPARWLGGRLYEDPRMPHRWAWMGVVFVSYTLVSWRMFRTLAIATPPGTTDPATLGPADPAVAPVLIVGGLVVLLAVACTLAGQRRDGAR